MEISNRNFYGDHLLLTVPSCTFSVIYNNCIFRGIDFSEIHVVSNMFTYCRFEDCIFAESLLSIFDGCTFINCKFFGTFKASLFDCDFDTHVPYMPMTCPVEGDIIGWKVCHGQNNRTPYLVKLHIPDGTEHPQKKPLYFHIMIKHFHIQKDDGYMSIVMTVIDASYVLVVFISLWSVKKRLIIMKVS